ncbi:MAG: response regulator [Pelolinea sp.]|nr:response regulator [Pelolinea sp.]
MINIKLNILLVDDNESNLLTLEAVLEPLGENLVCARSGREALRAVLEHEFAVILLDVQMPEIDGFETASMIRARERSMDTPIIFLTAISKTEIDMIKGYSTGAVDYVFKPFVPEILKAKVSAFIRLFRNEEQIKRQTEQLAAINRELEAKLTEVSRLNRELQMANEEMEAFSYSVSHDLRAPLRHIGNFSNILAKDFAEKLDAEGRQNFEFIQVAVVHMNQLIDDLMQLSRITHAPMVTEPVNLSVLVKEIAAELQSAQPERKAEWKISEGLIVQGDAGLLRIALENLLGNAWKYSAKKPLAHIEFGVLAQKPTGSEKPVPGGPSVRPQAEFFLRDNGAGFDMAFVDKLFTPFQRLHSQEDYGGTGIGLSIVRRIINRHGGNIRAEGKVGEGAVFTFTLEANPLGPVMK